MLRRFSWLLGLIPCFAPAQPISFGVTGGVPISPHSQVYGQECLGRPETCGPNNFLFRPYTIGPTVEVRLPWHVSVQAGALYQRFHKDITTGLRARFGSVNFGQRGALSADGLLIPLQLKYTFRPGRVAPFVNAGATLRRLGAFYGKVIQLDFNLQPTPESGFYMRSGRDLDVAITLGAGVRWRLSVVDLSPEIRFLHWTSTYYQPVQNQAMLMLTVTFPAVRR